MLAVSDSEAPPKAPSTAVIAVHGPPSTLTSAEATPLESVALAVKVTAPPALAETGARTGPPITGEVLSIVTENVFEAMFPLPDEPVAAPAAIWMVSVPSAGAAQLTLNV